MLAVFVQPFTSVPVTVYVVDEVEANAELFVTILSHVYVDAPPPFKVILVPEQIVLLLASDVAVTVGKVNRLSALPLVALFAEVVTTILPACGVASVVIVILVAVFVTVLIVHASPFKVTEVAEPKFVPVMVIVVAAFGHAFEGVKEVITGPGAA